MALERGGTKVKTWTDDGSAEKLVNVPVVEGEYKLVWHDEFDGDTLDRTKWSGSSHMNAPDIQLSLDPGTVDIVAGKAVLTANVIDRNATAGYRYSSNLALTTADTMNYKWGYLEMKAKVPFYGLGEWPSFWMHSRDSQLYKAVCEKKGTPYDPKYFLEIDIFEQFTSKNSIYPNIHKHNYKKRVHQQLSGIDQGGSINASGTRDYTFQSQEVANGWHTYGFLWTEYLMAFSVDGLFYYAYDISKEMTQKPEIMGMEDFDTCLYILINNMLFSEGMYERNPVEGNFFHKNMIKPGDEGYALFPLKYEIDYVRLYQIENYGELYTK